MSTDTRHWRPPHCPNPNCKFHKDLDGSWPYKRKGSYYRQTPPRRIPRFTCLHCHRNFSTQTFAASYWQKRPELAARIFLLVVGGMANRQIARALHVAHSTIQHQISRLGRHCLLFQTQLAAGTSPGPDIVFDGFETFELSQYFPFHHNLAVEADTGFFLHHTDSPLRRKGRMTDTQKERRLELERRFGRPDPRAVRRGVANLLSVATRGRREVRLFSDEHPSYPAALRSLDCRVEHRVTPGRAHRDQHNRLWEVNLLDLWLRHSLAAHRRETIAQVKRRQASAEKLTIFQVWRNVMKRRWENGPARSPAMLKGILDRILTVQDILCRRLFRTQIALPLDWSLYYDRQVETPALGVNRRHELSYAY